MPALFHRHDRHRRGVPQPRELRRQGALRHAGWDKLVDMLGNVMTDFGGSDKRLHQRLPHPLSRHLGHRCAPSASAKTPKVGPRRRGVPRIGAGADRSSSRPQLRWDAAMRDDDGGPVAYQPGESAPSPRPMKSRTNSRRKSSRSKTGCCNFAAAGSSIPTRTSIARGDRRRRKNARLAARRPATWFTIASTPLQQSLCLADGDELQLADCVETQKRKQGDALPRNLRGSCTSGRRSPRRSGGRSIAGAPRRQALARPRRLQRLRPLPVRLPFDRHRFRAAYPSS